MSMQIRVLAAFLLSPQQQCYLTAFTRVYAVVKARGSISTYSTVQVQNRGALQGGLGETAVCRKRQSLRTQTPETLTKTVTLSFYSTLLHLFLFNSPLIQSTTRSNLAVAMKTVTN